MDIDTTLSADKVLELTDSLVTKLNALLKKLKSVFLVEDFVESIKFGVGKILLIANLIQFYDFINSGMKIFPTSTTFFFK